MANMFKPEVGGAVGGTNISVYTPPSVDYSGIFSSVSNVFSSLADTGKAPTVSEGDKKAAALETISSGVDKIWQIEDPVKREVAWKKYKLNSFKAFPQYTDDATKLFDKVEGYAYSDTGGKSLEDIKTTSIFTWAEKTPDGQMAFADAYYKNGGDTEKVKSALEVEYFTSQARDKQLQIFKKDVETLKLSKESAAIQIRPIIQADVDKAVSSAISQLNVVRDNAVKNGQDPDIAVLDAGANMELMLQSMIQSKYNETGLTPTETDTGTYLNGFKAYLKLAETSKDFVQRSSLNQNQKIVTEALAKSGLPPVIQIAIQKGDSPEVTSALLRSADTEKGFKNFLTSMTEIQNTRTSILGPQNAPPIVGTPSPNLAPSDSPTQVSSMYQGVYNPEVLSSLMASSTTQLQHVRDLGMRTARSLNGQDLQPEDAINANKAIGSMFASIIPQIDKTGESLKPNMVSQFMSNSVLGTIEGVNKKDKASGEVLYSQVNQYATASVTKLISDFNAQMSVISGENPPPFILSMDDKNNLSFEINKSVLKTNPYLMKAMGAYRYETVGRGGTRAIPLPVPAETDPYKVLDSYLNLTGSIITEGAEKMFWKGGGTTNEIKSMVDSLQLILKQSEKIPPEIRKNIDAAEILRQNFGKEKVQ